MPGSNGNGVRFSVDNRETSKGFGVEPESTIGKDSDSLQHERNGDIYIPSTGWVSPSQAYQNARSNGLTRRASRLYADQGKFLYGMSQDEPDFDYVMSVLRQQGLSRRAARQAMRNPEFWRNVRRKYGPQQQPQQQQQIGITVAPADAKEAELSRNSGGARPLTVGMGHTTAYQSGGKVGKDSEIQNAFIAYLIQQSNAQTQDELEQFVQSIGEDGLKSLYKKFVQSMQQGTQSAKNGAKLNYIKSLRGKCPEGYELGYFKEGGKVCAKCVEKREKEGALPFKPIQGEKGTKVVQDFKKDLKNKKDKITVPSKKPQKKEEGGTLDITIRQDLLDMFKCGGKMKQKDGGLVKKNNKIPIKEKFIDKDKCGSKMKKKKK